MTLKAPPLMSTIAQASLGVLLALALGLLCGSSERSLSWNTYAGQVITTA